MEKNKGKAMQTYTCEEAAKILKCNAVHIRSICRNGEIKAFKAGRSWVITEKELENYIIRLQNQQAQAVIDKRSKETCQSTLTNTEYGKYPFVHQAAAELDALLKPQTAKRRKNCTIN